MDVRVRLLQIRALPEGIDKVGKVVAVSAEVAAQMVADRSGELVDDVDALPTPNPIQTAEHPAAAAGRRGRRQ